MPLYTAVVLADDENKKSKGWQNSLYMFQRAANDIVAFDGILTRHLRRKFKLGKDFSEGMWEYDAPTKRERSKNVYYQHYMDINEDCYEALITVTSED